MPQRGYVLIFVFWALLTLITPTLIFWSASAKTNLASQEETRRMMVSLERRGHLKNRTAALAPVPAPAPLPVMGNGTVRCNWENLRVVCGDPM